MAFMSFFGYFFFVLFGGVGLSALPLDMIRAFTGRPKIITKRDAMEKKQLLKRKATELIEHGENLKVDEKEVRATDGWWAKYKVKR